MAIWAYPCETVHYRPFSGFRVRQAGVLAAEAEMRPPSPGSRLI